MVIDRSDFVEPEWRAIWDGASLKNIRGRVLLSLGVECAKPIVLRNTIIVDEDQPLSGGVQSTVVPICSRSSPRPLDPPNKRELLFPICRRFGFTAEGIGRDDYFIVQRCRQVL
ncbi:MAG: hypothetical protein SynsKO_12960 [Synoicihabitans sp.]